MSRSLLSHRSRPLLFSPRLSSLESFWKVIVVIVHVHVSVSVYVRTHRHTDTEPLEKHVFLSSFPQDSWSGALSGSANDQRRSGTCCSRLALKHSMVRSSGCSADLRLQVLSRFLFNFVFVKGSFVSVFSFPLLPSPPSRSHVPKTVCRSQHASACTFKTSPCVLAPRFLVVFSCGPVAGTHGDVLNAHTEACRDPHTGFSKFFQRAAPPTVHHRPHHRHHMHSHTQHNITHNITRRQGPDETEKEDREREREKGR